MQPSLISSRVFQPPVFVYLAGIFFILSSVVLSFFTKTLPSQQLFWHYFVLNKASILWIGTLLFYSLLIQFGFLWARAGWKGIDPFRAFSTENLQQVKKGLLGFFKNTLQVGLPFLFAFYALLLALGQLNVFNKNRLQDELVARLDILLTATFPSLSLGFIHYPSFFVKAVDFSFLYLGGILGIFGVYLFQFHQKLFREAAGAFFLGLTIMFMGWIFFPALSPHDRFIDNVYNLPVPGEIQEYLEQYHPQEEISAFLERIRNSKKNLERFPTSTLPSAHVAWAVLLVYYSWRLHPWLIAVAGPFALLSTFGAVLFAQHYFIDIPAGVLVGIISIWIVKLMGNKELLFSFARGKIAQRSI